jgi:hypothetical protein
VTLVSGVLDIAGGKQHVSQYLALTYGIRCTVVDPRPAEPISPCNILTFEKRGHQLPSYHMAFFDSEFLANHQELVKSCSCLIGQHPDEATEPIVDVAIKLRKPFAVVPCCVFSKLFVRKLISGKYVTTYEQFVQYLKEKCLPNQKPTTKLVNQDVLDLKGRCIVLFAREIPSA